MEVFKSLEFLSETAILFGFSVVVGPSDDVFYHFFFGLFEFFEFFFHDVEQGQSEGLFVPYKVVIFQLVYEFLFDFDIIRRWSE